MWMASPGERRVRPIDGDRLARRAIEQQRDVRVAGQTRIAGGLVAVVIARLDTGASGHEREDERAISLTGREHERRPAALPLLQVDVGTKPETTRNRRDGAACVSQWTSMLEEGEARSRRIA